MLKLIIQTDGGSRGNPGPAACACVILDKTSGESADNLRELHTNFEYLGVTTNNVAEYRAVLLAYSWLVKHKTEISSADFLLDSNLVVSQLNGVFRVKEGSLAKLVNEIKENEKEIGPEKISYKHVYREENTQADKLVNLCLDNRG